VDRIRGWTIQELAARYDQVWLVLTWDLDRPYHEAQDKGWLDQHSRLLDEAHFRSADLYLYDTMGLATPGKNDP
jgi:hypothetical protein